MNPDYVKSFDCSTKEPLQQKLNEIYRYKGVQTMYMHRLRLNLFYDTVKRLIENKTIKSFDKAIDIGCNCGFYSKLISGFGFKDVYGVDISSDSVERATQYFKLNEGGKSIHFELVNAEVMDTTKQYDFILCTEVIEHTGKPQLVIDNISKVLKPGGVAIISLPNGFSLPYLLTRISYGIRGKKMDQELIDHLSYPFYKSNKIFEGKGLKLIETTGTNLFYWNFMHKLPLFGFLNKINYYLAKTSLFKSFSQFYFLVLTKA